MSLGKDDSSFPKTVEKPPESSSTSGSINTAENNGRLKGYFCSKVVFNLSRKVLTETEICILEKGLGFASTATRINESDLKRDLNELS